MKASKRYDLAKQLSMAAAFIGCLLMISHLAGQVSVGSAPGWTLIAGAAGAVLGPIFTLLFVICIRLERLEKRLSDHEEQEISADGADAGESALLLPPDDG